MDLHKRKKMGDDERLCIRCRGRKRLYKGMGGWSLSNFGSTLSDCPMCLGEGKIKKIPAKELFKEEKEEIKDVKEAKRRKAKKFEKDF